MDHGIPEQEERLCCHRGILFGGEGGREQMETRISGAAWNNMVEVGIKPKIQ